MYSGRMKYECLNLFSIFTKREFVMMKQKKTYVETEFFSLFIRMWSKAGACYTEY